LIAEWAQGKFLKIDYIMSMVAMVFLVFMNINMMAFFGIQGFTTYLAILERIGDVMKLEEFKMTRKTDGDPFIKCEDCSFNWGFKVSEDQKDA
jgi:hypothetical protein